MGGDALRAGKVTGGLASHWPRVTDISGSPPTGSRGRWAPAYALFSGVWWTLLLLYHEWTQMRSSRWVTPRRWTENWQANIHNNNSSDDDDDTANNRSAS